ncbi:hypothetical protein [uncultured Erythrobacter sp.]|uniref:hypothetical protein n=1 Tax=uncultured Erythrobacter sp. TaxID=263913 RepID=UPI00265A3E94|nr:hypothetical protein [uncultured Erythrobacter sp.]
MTQARTPASPLALAPIRHDGWTTQRQVTFLDALAASHSVSEAARAVGMSRQSAYALRARLKGEPFDLAWTAAFRCRFDALAEAALDRAINGVEVQHFYNGELVGTTRRYDERLTLALLAMRGTGGARRTSASHPAAEYGPEDFGPLRERVEQGPETWDEQLDEEREALYAEYDAAEAARLAEEEGEGGADYDADDRAEGVPR